MTAQVIDYTEAALNRMARNAERSGNVFECYALTQLLEGYREGIWRVHWIDGEPQFEAALSQEELVDRLVEKDQ